MNAVGVIAEYNPFHNGHKYHLRQAKELSNAGFAVAAMSGDFTQRGTPAIFDKYARTKMALMEGADLVVEMPAFGCTASAADFALCGVSLLSRTGVVDTLCFGSESGDLPALVHDSEEEKGLQPAKKHDTADDDKKLREYLRAGLSYPAAAAKAGHAGFMLSQPNDILGREYLRALRQTGSLLRPMAVKRCDGGYHSRNLIGSFASATAVRHAYENQDQEILRRSLPPSVYRELPSLTPVGLDDFSFILNERILRMRHSDFIRYADITAEIAAWLAKERLNFCSASDRVRQLKKRQYTYTRISRALLHLTLLIEKEEIDRFKSLGSAPWIRILGFRKSALPLLSELKKRSAAPIISKTADAGRILAPNVLALWEKNLYASELYRLAAQLKTGQSIKNEYTRSVVTVEN